MVAVAVAKEKDGEHRNGCQAGSGVRRLPQHFRWRGNGMNGDGDVSTANYDNGTGGLGTGIVSIQIKYWHHKGGFPFPKCTKNGSH